MAGALAALGYDRSFAPGALDRDEVAPAGPRASFAEVRLDPRTRTVSRPPGLQIDLGGMIKGHTADRAARRLPEDGALDAGGDAVLRGAGPDGEGWLVEVEDPADATRVLLTTRVRDGAVATSAANRRRWRAGDRSVHHLVDPRTGLPAATDLTQATVFARFAELADVLAKTAFLLGAREARRLLSRIADTSAVLVRGDGAIEIVGKVEVIQVQGVRLFWNSGDSPSPRPPWKPPGFPSRALWLHGGQGSGSSAVPKEPHPCLSRSRPERSSGSSSWW